MDFLAELENLAERFKSPILEPDTSTIERWRRLFHVADPLTTIIDFRSSLNAPDVSDTHWEEVRHEQERHGHDRESYTYSLTLPKSHNSIKNPSGTISGTYLLQLIPSCLPISSAKAVQQTAALHTPPLVRHNEGDTDAEFVQVSSDTRKAIETVLARDYPQMRAVFMFVHPPSPKVLDPASRYPSLGISTILPQYRPTATTDRRDDLVQQHEFPVWYFFYGNLAKSDILQNRLRGLHDEIKYVPARVRGGKMKTWAGKYNALVDGGDVISGSAFLVKNKEVEDVLRQYETDKYEVVRCYIEMEKEVKHGLVFRFVG